MCCRSHGCSAEHQGCWHQRWVNVRTFCFQTVNRSPGHTGTIGKPPEPEQQLKAESGQTSLRGQIPAATGQCVPQVGAE